MTTRAAVTACDLNYAAGAEAVLRGLRRVHPEVARYVFVPPAELDAARGRFAGLAEVLAPPRPLAGVPTHGHHQMLVARMFVGTFPHDVVAWLDCDTVVCRPLPDLWEVAPGRVRAVMDRARKITYVLPPRYQDGFRRAFPAAADRHGFNSGVFAVRPADWPDLPDRFERGLAACGYPAGDYPAPFDQPFLNHLWLDRVDPLGIEYNAHCNFDHPIPAGVRVVHFTSTVKPWMPGFSRYEPAYYYWLRYGEGEERAGPLLRAKARIWARTPRRVASRFLRARGLLGSPGKA